MIVAGIDYSMTSPAVCVKNTETGELRFYSLSSASKKFNGFFKHGLHSILIEEMPPHTSPMQRYDAISQWAMSKLISNSVETVSMEGYSMGSSSGMVFNIAENGGILKYKMFRAKIPFNMPSPTQVKKRFAGKGNAKKDDMCNMFYETLGFKPHELYGGKPAGSPENDLVDSYANMLFAGEKLD